MSKDRSKKPPPNQHPFSRREILVLLEQPGSPSLTAKALLVRLGGDPRKGSALRSLLAEMVTAGEIERAGRRYRVKREPGSKKRHGVVRKKAFSSITGKLAAVPSSTLLLILLALSASVGLAYLNALDNGFVNWDDPRYVVGNQHIKELSWDTIRWAFTSFDASNWHPLTWISLAIDYQNFGLEPWGYHLTSVLLHIANTFLVFLVLFLLTGAVWKSAVVAALFGLHPTHVESVAWIAERKDVLSTLFWFLAIAAYTGFTRTRSTLLYLLVLLGFVLGLLSKPMVITLPVILLLLDYWPLARVSKQALLEKIPLFLLAAVSAFLTLGAQTSGGAVGIDSISFGDRVVNAFFSYAKYVWLTLWPVNLSPWYSHPALEGQPLSWVMISGSMVLVIGITCCAFYFSRQRPYIIVGWLWYVITLSPVIGIIQIGRQGMADRYLYIPQVGLLIIVVWAASELPIWKHRSRALGATAVVLTLGALGLATHEQTKVWRNNQTLWTNTAETSPDSFIAHQALGGVLLRQKKTDEALNHYQIAAEIRPEFHSIQSRVGDLLRQKGEIKDAAEYYLKAVQVSPDSAEYRRKLAAALTGQGDFQEALNHLRIASDLEPDSSQTHYLLARAHRTVGEFEEAEVELNAALDLNPGFEAAQRELQSLLSDMEEGMSVVR